MLVGQWTCDRPDCKRKVEFDGNSYGLFNMRRRDKKGRWAVFTRALLDKLYSFIVTARSTYTAATRYLSSDMLSFALRRQEVVKLGTAMLRTFVLPPEVAVFPLCGPDPKFIVIDGQALGCTDLDDAQPVRIQEEVPVLDIAASALCVIQSPPLRGAITKILRSSAALTGPQTLLLRAWHNTIGIYDRACVETAAARLFCHFFPMGTKDGGVVNGPDGTPGASRVVVGKKGAEPGAGAEGSEGVASGQDGTASTTALKAEWRTNADGNLTLGGQGAPTKPPSVSWHAHVGQCPPDFEQ